MNDSIKYIRKLYPMPERATREPKLSAKNLKMIRDAKGQLKLVYSEVK